MDTKNAYLAAALMMSAAAVLNGIDAAIVRLLVDVHPFVIGFFRALFGLLFVMPMIVRRPAILVSGYRATHAVRAALKLGGLLCFFVAFTLAPLADVTAIIFLSPILLAVGAWLFLGEKLGPMRVFAIAAGFSGALIIINPGGSGALEPALLLALAGSALMALAQLVLKKMSQRDSTDTLVAWNLILTVPLALIPAILVWTTPSWTAFGLLIVQGVCGALNMALVTRAFSHADASFLAPFDFIRLPAVALIAFLLFGQVAGLSTWIGAGIIFAATLIASRKNPARID